MKHVFPLTTAASRNEGVGVNSLGGGGSSTRERLVSYTQFQKCVTEFGVSGYIASEKVSVCFQVSTYGFLHAALKVCPIRGQGPACGAPVFIMPLAVTIVNYVCVCVCVYTGCFRRNSKYFRRW